MKKLFLFLFAAMFFCAVYANTGTKDDGKRLDFPILVETMGESAVKAKVILITETDTLTEETGKIEYTTIGKDLVSGELQSLTSRGWGVKFKQLPLGQVMIVVNEIGYEPYREKYEIIDVDEWNREHPDAIAPKALLGIVMLEPIKTPKKKKK